MSWAKFSIGQHVRVRYSGQEGTIIDIIDGSPRLYMVSIGDGRKVETYSESDLERAF